MRLTNNAMFKGFWIIFSLGAPEAVQTENFFKCIIFIYFFFMLIFLACDIKKKQKEKLELVHKGDGLVKNLLLHVSVFKSVPVSLSRKGELCTIISIFSQPLLVLFQDWSGALETGMYVVTCSSSPLPRWWHIYGAVSLSQNTLT